MTATVIGTDLCECGCGEQVNPRLSLARELRAEGLPFSKIGESLNCSGAYAKALLVKPPRFVKGHNGRVDYGFGECVSCGKRFAKHGPTQTVCNNGRTCAKARQEANWSKWAEYDREVDERRERRERLVAQRRDLRRLIQGKLPFGNDAFREQKLVEVEYAIEVLTDELKVLYEAQCRDDTPFPRAGGKWIFSLDAPWRGDDDSLYEYRPGDDAVAAAFQSFNGGAVGDGWTDVVHAIVDRRREIDAWAEQDAA